MTKWSGVSGPTEIYISVDVEADGPVPGLNSMLSIGAVALHPETLEEDSSFYKRLDLLPYATQHPDTMTWWSGRMHLYEETRRETVSPKAAMTAFERWVAELATKYSAVPVFVAYPITFDFAYYTYYAHRFVGNPVMRFSGLDMSSMAMGMIGGQYDTNVRRNWPPRWTLGADGEADHIAIEDARKQATIFARMLKELRS